MTGAQDYGTLRATAAAFLIASRLSGSVLEALPDNLRPPDDLAGYGVQQCAHVLLERAGFGRQIGWKIGCTTEAMQKYLGVQSPCAGGMFQANSWRGHHRFTVPENRRLGAECEIAVRLGVDLPARAAPYEQREVARSVAASMAAIEVVEDRYADYSALDGPTLIADDFFHHSCVLGPEVEEFDPQHLRDTSAAMFVNDQPAGSGRGEDVMGDPLAALTWLANNCVVWGTPLLAGEIVLLGSVVPPHWVVDDVEVRVANDGLGEARARFVRA
jgi:2-keto-4-pentenoate hydratase